MILLITVSTLIACTAAYAKRPTLALQTSQAIVATWTCSDQLGQPRQQAYSPWKPHTQAFRRAQLNLWTLRHKACTAALHERARQWNWRAWLPDVWRAIAECETPAADGTMNWQHNSGTYQGAFGFARSSWDAFKLPGYPAEAYEATPWQQYKVALRIHDRYGFSGWGCYTGGGYRSHL